MDINFTKNVDNFNDVRRRRSFPNSISSRSTLVMSKAFTIPYHKRIEIQNDFSNKEFREPINSSQLSYDNKSQESYHVNIAIDPVFSQGPQCISNEVLALNFSYTTYIDNDNIINI